MLVDSKHQKLSTQEIISVAAQETGGEFTPEQAQASVIAEVHQLGAFAVREGNTLFIIHKDPENPRVGVFRALNADTARNYLENSIAFIKLARTSFDLLVTEFEDPSIINIFKYMKRNPPFPHMDYEVHEDDDGEGYLGIVNFNAEAKGGLEAAK